MEEKKCHHNRITSQCPICTNWSRVISLHLDIKALQTHLDWNPNDTYGKEMLDKLKKERTQLREEYLELLRERHLELLTKGEIQ